MSDEAPTLGDHIALADEHLRSTFAWYTVAKKEYKDAIRSKGLWVLALVFTILFVMPPAGAIYFDIIQINPGTPQAEFGMQALISQFYTTAATFLVPIVAMFVGFGAITRERETGSLKILLSLPHSRRDVIVGKVLGRCAVVGVPLAISLLLTALFLVTTSVTFKPELYALFSLYTLGLALVFVAIAVSISGAVSQGLYSIIANFVVYFYFSFGWNSLANAIGNGLSEYLGVTGAPRWHATLLIKLLNPTQAYKTLTRSMLGEGGGAALRARFGMFNQDKAQMKTICGDVLNGSPATQEGLFGKVVVCEGNGLPFYYSDAAVFVFLLLWIGVAAVISYKTFNLADL